MNIENIEQYRIFECITGSRLYGNFTHDSDYDYRGVVLMPREILLNPFENFEQKDSGFEENDRVLFSLDKFFKLCANGNPNIVELLFVPKHNSIFWNNKWNKIIENRQYFLSKKIRHTFTGYAFSQIERIKRHRKWLLNPVEKKPNRLDYDLPEMSLFGFERLQNLLHAPKEAIMPEFRDYAVREMNYRTDHDEWEKYQNWKKTRNPARFVLEEKYHYDVKHASHIFRLMDEGKQLLLDKNITFPLRNIDLVNEVRNGKYTYDEVLEMAQNMEKDFETWENQSTLPFAPNRNKLLELYYELVL